MVVRDGQTIGEDEMECSRCGSEMLMVYQDKSRAQRAPVLWKCKADGCGHMTLIQEWDRDDVADKEKSNG